MKNVITKIARLSDKLSRPELNELEQQTQTKFIFKGVCGEIDFYANCSDVFKIKYKRSGTQYLIKGLEVSENEFYKTYNHIWRILENNNNIKFSQITEWDSQRDLEAPYNMIPCAIKTFVIDVYAFKDGKVIYHDIKMNKHEATVNSSFYHEIDSVQATGKYGAIVSTTPVNHTYKIDGNCVDHETFNGVINLFKGANSTADFDVSFDNPHIDKPIKIVFEPNTEPILRFHNGSSISVDGDFTSIAEKVYKELYESPAWEVNNPALKNIKENEDMPKIVDYTYIEHDKVTKIKWSDGSETVVCGSDDNATQFCGYVCAIAKKAMGNNGKMLAEWDRLVVKPVERAKKAEEKKRLAAEKKAEEERIREEAKAKRMAKNAKYYEEREKRRKQREIETLAEQIAKEYEQDKLYAEAMKLAIEKYKVPCNYFANDCDCHCDCKEFDVMDDENITD